MVLGHPSGRNLGRPLRPRPSTTCINRGLDHRFEMQSVRVDFDRHLSDCEGTNELAFT